jgi:putative hydrolase of the HAD superfamily
VFDDVHPTLARFQDANIAMGVLSNFDERLKGILSDLGLIRYFDFVYTSWDCGVMKPNALLFRMAAMHFKLDEHRHQILHIGDDHCNDYIGATTAGLQARLLCRRPTNTEITISQGYRIHSLLEIFHL